MNKKDKEKISIKDGKQDYEIIKNEENYCIYYRKTDVSENKKEYLICNFFIDYDSADVSSFFDENGNKISEAYRFSISSKDSNVSKKSLIIPGKYLYKNAEEYYKRLDGNYLIENFNLFKKYVNMIIKSTESDREKTKKNLRKKGFNSNAKKGDSTVTTDALPKKLAKKFLHDVYDLIQTHPHNEYVYIPGESKNSSNYIAVQYSGFKDDNTTYHCIHYDDAAKVLDDIRKTNDYSVPDNKSYIFEGLKENFLFCIKQANANDKNLTVNVSGFGRRICINFEALACELELTDNEDESSVNIEESNFFYCDNYDEEDSSYSNVTLHIGDTYGFTQGFTQETNEDIGYYETSQKSKDLHDSDTVNNNKYYNQLVEFINRERKNLPLSRIAEIWGISQTKIQVLCNDIEDQKRKKKKEKKKEKKRTYRFDSYFDDED